MTASPQLLVSRVVFAFTLLLALNATSFCAGSALALAESPVSHTSHTTMVIFTDHPMEDDQWAALAQELRRADIRLETAARELGGGLEVLRGRDLVAGVSVDQVISVTVNGDCTLLPGPRKMVRGALGWVKKVDGEIQPFIHVSCERIVEMLQGMALGMNRERRNTVMAEAMSRVIAHEWIHIARQEASHESSGVMQSQFQVSDLLADDDPIYPGRHIGRDKRHVSGF
ncbi:MAG: hypothetical protein JST28_22480 [Acidobacteria bacterium]|nr:hypothetical protein [Acidobacteriota bacterium]